MFFSWKIINLFLSVKSKRNEKKLDGQIFHGLEQI